MNHYAEVLAMIEASEVKTISEYTLLLKFNNGEERRFDMRPYLRYPVFKRLENRGYFLLTRVNYGTVTWPGEIDIAPETLYEESIPLH
jgi:hypothetical protein